MLVVKAVELSWACWTVGSLAAVAASVPYAAPVGVTTVMLAPSLTNSPTVFSSVCSSSTVATTTATPWTSWRAWSMARFSARFWTSRHSGMTKATTTAEVVAPTSSVMRRRTGQPIRSPRRTPTPRTLCR